MEATSELQGLALLAGFLQTRIKRAPFDFSASCTRSAMHFVTDGNGECMTVVPVISGHVNSIIRHKLSN
jgi:hypothetical protein